MEKARKYVVIILCPAEGHEGGHSSQIRTIWSYDARDAITQATVLISDPVERLNGGVIVSVDPHPDAIPNEEAAHA